jgi:hypothetical protein
MVTGMGLTASPPEEHFRMKLGDQRWVGSPTHHFSILLLSYFTISHSIEKENRLSPIVAPVKLGNLVRAGGA